jgi:hypothetical protein
MVMSAGPRLSKDNLVARTISMSWTHGTCTCVQLGYDTYSRIISRTFFRLNYWWRKLRVFAIKFDIGSDESASSALVSFRCRFACAGVYIRSVEGERETTKCSSLDCL